MPKILITKPDIAEEENKRRIEMLYGLLSEIIEIIYQDEQEKIELS